MKSLLLDLLFPKKCVGCKKLGSYLCAVCFARISFYEDFICPVCLRPSVSGMTHPRCLTTSSINGLFSGVCYSGIIKRLLYQFKYDPYISNLKSTLGELMCESLNQNELFVHTLNTEPLLASVPLHKSKEKKRGYNHASLLSSYVAQYFSQDYNNNLLTRIKNTEAQFRLNKASRLENIKNAFSLNMKYKEDIKDKVIFLVDDVATTCTTLRECAKVLKRNGAKEVYGVTFAKEL